MTEDPVFQIEIAARSVAELKAFTDEFDPDLGCRPVARRRGEEFVVAAYLPQSRLEAARAARAGGGVSVRVLENVTQAGLERQNEVGQGNRFAARGSVPRGLGLKE